MNHFLDVYETMLGLREPGSQFPGVEDAFAEGELCADAYDQMRRAYSRLCQRLGVFGEDRDLNLMVDSMERIQKELCRRMYSQK